MNELTLQKKVKLIKKALQEIPIEIKADLINKELNDCNLVVVLRSEVTTTQIAAHIESGNVDLGKIMQAMAYRVKKELEVNCEK
jgi:hypothetical protein